MDPRMGRVKQGPKTPLRLRPLLWVGYYQVMTLVGGFPVHR